VLVLVTDGEDRAALAACRALARAGHTVAVAAGRRPAPAHSSRACATRLYVPRSLAAEEFVSGLATALLTTTYDALLPASDAALLALSRFRERLPSPLLLGLPPRDAIARSLSKLALLEEAGVACLSGTSFGEFGEGYLRFSIANSMENLGKALERVQHWVSQKGL